MSVDNNINMEIEENDIIIVEMRKIEELDASIDNLEMQMKMENEKLSKFQSQNRKKLRKLLLFTPKECGILWKNTDSFLNLCNSEKIDDSEEQKDDDNDSGETFNIISEDKARLEKLINEKDFDIKSQSSPYFITDDFAFKGKTVEKFN